MTGAAAESLDSCDPATVDTARVKGLSTARGVVNDCKSSASASSFPYACEGAAKSVAILNTNSANEPIGQAVATARGPDMVSSPTPSLGLGLDLPKPASAGDQSRSLQDPEALAHRILQDSSFDSEALPALFDSLPKDPAREGVQSQGRRFSTGMFVHGGVCVACTEARRTYLLTAQTLRAVVKQVCPQLEFNAVTVPDNSNSGCHRDSHNMDLSSIVIPLTHFQGGGLWHESSQGDVAKDTPHGSVVGVVMDVNGGPKVLPSPKRWHAVEPWKGDGVVLVAYSARCNKLSQVDQDKLTTLGFPVPAASACATKDLRNSLTIARDARKALACKPDPPPTHLPGQSCPEQMLFVEFCCGSAVLSKAAEAAGFRTFQVDNDKHRAPSKKTVFLDFGRPGPTSVCQRLDPC